MHQILGLFIPIIALSIPLTAVIGRTIVAPLLAARHRPADDHRVQMLEQRLALMEQNMEAMERSMAQISEVAEFHRQLAMPRRRVRSEPATSVASAGPATLGQVSGPGRARHARPWPARHSTGARVAHPPAPSRSRDSSI